MSNAARSRRWFRPVWFDFRLSRFVKIISSQFVIFFLFAFMLGFSNFKNFEKQKAIETPNRLKGSSSGIA